MIIETILVPPSSRKTFTSESEQVLYLHWCIHVLQQLLENAVLLTDDHGVLKDAVAAWIHAWPQKYRKRGMHCLTQLKKENRIVEVPLMASANPPPSQYCELARAILDTYKPRLSVTPTLLLPDGCQCGAANSCSTHGTSDISFSRPILLDFLERRRTSTAVVHQFEELTQQQFQEIVLDPMLRYARRVTLVDRYIGRSCLSWNGNGKNRPSIAMKREFRAGIEWILRQFVRLSPKAKLFEIYTDTGPCGSSSVASELVKYLHGLQLELEKPYQSSGVRVEIHVKQFFGYGRQSFNHDRYLFTDQFGFLFSRGFDLIDPRPAPSRKVRDGAVFLLLNDRSTKLLGDITKLPNAR